MLYLWRLISVIVLITGCSTEDTVALKTEILTHYRLDLLRDKPYEFHAKDVNAERYKQTLRQWDMIFAGKHTTQESEELDFTRLIPGLYSHLFLYLGVDSEGDAYVVEMALEKSSKVSIEMTGIKLDGRIFIHVFGHDVKQSDNTLSDIYYDMSQYDFYTAKRLRSDYRDQVIANEEALRAGIRENLKDSLIYQSPIFFHFDVNTTKEIFITDDGFVNGSHCAEYVVLLLEAHAGICFNDVYLDANEIEYYFTNDAVGKTAKIPEKYNFLGDGDLYIYELFDQDYQLKYMPPRNSVCNVHKDYRGMVTPDKLFKSSHLESL